MYIKLLLGGVWAQSGSALSRLVACEFFRQERFHERIPGDFENTLIKTGDSEKREELKVEEAAREREGRAALAL